LKKLIWDWDVVVSFVYCMSCCCCCCKIVLILNWKLNKKIWEELITYFPLIRLAPNRKRRVKYGSIFAYILVAVGTCLPSCCLATIGGDAQTARCSLKSTLIFAKYGKQAKNQSVHCWKKGFTVLHFTWDLYASVLMYIWL
jgi:hypothetical protein